MRTTKIPHNSHSRTLLALLVWQRLRMKLMILNHATWTYRHMYIHRIKFIQVRIPINLNKAEFPLYTLIRVGIFLICLLTKGYWKIHNYKLMIMKINMTAPTNFITAFLVMRKSLFVKVPLPLNKTNQKKYHQYILKINMIKMNAKIWGNF